jgi:hypothetical protein
MTNEEMLRAAEQAFYAQTKKCNEIGEEVRSLKTTLTDARAAEEALAHEEDATPKQYAAAAKAIRDADDAHRQAVQRQKVQTAKHTELADALTRAQKQVNADAQVIRARAANAAASRVDAAYEELNLALAEWRKVYGEAAAYAGDSGTMRDMQRILWLVSAAKLREVQLPSATLPTGYEFDGYFDAVKNNPSLPRLAEVVYV